MPTVLACLRRSVERMWPRRVPTRFGPATRLRRPKNQWNQGPLATQQAEMCPRTANSGQGERLYDWARVRLLPPPDGGGDAPPRERWLLVRRSIPDLAYFVVFAPAGPRLLDLARVAGRRWPVEECFEAAEQEVGLADYEVRSWRGWHRHVTLAMLALALLAGLRAGLNGLKGAQGPLASSSRRSASPRSAA